ncbi:MAG: hypothetical protein Q9227_005957 [Pyrenula ochraceoflavens]
MGLFSRENRFPVKGKTAIITGGSQGLGLEIATSLSRRGANVLIVAQAVPKLQSALKTISSAALNPEQQRFHYISADLRSSDSAVSILSEATNWNNGTAPDIVWCCAGHCLPGFFADNPIETHRGQMDTVYWSVANMAHAALNTWLHPAKASNNTPTPSHTTPRHLIFTASTLAFVTVAGYGPYSAAKAAIRSLSDTLRQEIEMYNATKSVAPIEIHTLFPMGILSPGFENEQKLKPALTLQLEKDDKPQTPEEVAEVAIARLEEGQFMITTMLQGHVMKGVAYGASSKNSFVGDTFWGFLGWMVFNLFMTADFLRQCRNWGREKGLERVRSGKGD